MNTEILFQDILSEEDSEKILSLKGPILIIGAGGFIGSKFLFALLRRRKDVFGVIKNGDINWRLSYFPNLENIKDHLLSCDITEFEEMKSVIQKINPGSVFNLSAYGGYENQSEALKIHQVNYLGVVNLLSTLEKSECEAFVQAGSSSEYGINCSGPKENGPLMPNSDYSVSKGATSLLISYYGKIKSFPCVNLRLYSIYGPWEDRKRLIPNLIRHGLNHSFPDFADKNTSRDFVYVDDCLRALILAAIHARSNAGLSFNIGTGDKKTLEEVAHVSKSIFNISQEPHFNSMRSRKWDLSNWYSDSSFAFEKLGWKSKVSIAEGLSLAKDWEIAAKELNLFETSKTTTKKITAIIACYKDNQAIPIMYERLVKAFQKEAVNYEIIFVNDCSPFNDEDVIKSLCKKDPNVIGISHSRNFGSQSAFMSGMELSTGDAVVLLDGDLQDPPELIPEFIKQWLNGFEVVYGERLKREAPILMQIAYKTFYRIFKGLSDIKIPVDAGDFSLIDKRVVEHLLKMPEKDFFLRGLRAWVGFKQIGVPYTRPERMFGVTTNNFFKNVWWAKKAIFSYSTKPLSYIQIIGIVIFVLSFLLGLFYLIYHILYPSSGPKGVTTIVILILGLGGIQILSLSILGDYIGKILEEVKNRPRYIRARVIRGDKVIENQENT